jgi:uncharacterized membrane protein YidH (DUF202 family)
MQAFRAVHARQIPLVPPDPATEAVKTWRYLRLAMVLVVIGLGVSVLYEHRQTGTGCWQESISAYYYTPVQGVFVGALVTVGICLIALKGNTDWEDILLNFAGVSAPVVAFVPTPDPGTCGSVLTDTPNRDMNVANNMTAFLVAGGLALVVLGAVLVSARRGNSSPQQPTRTSVVGYLLTVVLYLGTVLVFGLARNWFTAHGHDVAAIAMFTFIIANVWLNAINLHFTRKDATGSAPVVNPYTVIGVLMIAAVVVTTVLGLVAHWAYWKLALEANLIALFAVFWVLQTIELWDQGLRQEALPSAPRATEEASPARTR